MKKFLLVYSILVILFCFSAKGVLAKSNGITKSEASKIITKHFNDYYMAVHIGTTAYMTIIEENLFREKIESLNDFKKTGLIDYQVIQPKLGDMKKIKVALTEKGRNTYHIPFKTGDDNTGFIGFIGGKREIIEIVEIDSKTETIFFSYKFEPNEVGTALGYSKNKYRGKAKIAFDTFLKMYVLKSIASSPWEEEKWDNVQFSYEIEGKKVFTVKPYN